MKFLISYIAISIIVTCWTGLHIYKKLDRFDWTFHRTKIWVALVLRAVFWPLMLLFKPAELLWPKFGFRTSMLGIGLAKSARERSQFMESPPPCSSKIIYRTLDEDSKATTALYYFSASAVEIMAKEIIKETHQVAGLHATAKWVALRNEQVEEPTELPSALVNFDYICEGLIEAGHGQVHCMACNKLYMASELINQTGLTGSWLIADYSCPAKHLLMSRELAHFMFKRNYE